MFNTTSELINKSPGCVLCCALPDKNVRGNPSHHDLNTAYRNADKTYSIRRMQDTDRIKGHAFPDAKYSERGERFYLKTPAFMAYMAEQGKILRDQIDQITPAEYIASWRHTQSCYDKWTPTTRIIGVPFDSHYSTPTAYALSFAMDDGERQREELDNNVFGSWIPKGTDADTLTLAFHLLWMHHNLGHTDMLSHVFDAPLPCMFTFDVGVSRDITLNIANLELIHEEYDSVHKLFGLLASCTSIDRILKKDTVIKYNETAWRMMLERVSNVATDILVGVKTTNMKTWKVVSDLLTSGSPDCEKAILWAKQAILKESEEES